MATTDFIAAIELGSSKISGMAGKKNSNGSIQVLTYAREEASSFMHKGVIYNIAKAAAALTAIIERLEEQLNAKVAQVYVGIGGQSLHSLKSSVGHSVDEEEGTVSQALIDALYDENRETPLADLCIFDVVPQEYKVDHTLQADPVGATGQHVTGQYLNLVARASIKKNVEMAFAQANIQIADDLIVSALSTAKAVLSQTEMRQGCALVDMGADTTTVSIYKNNLLRHLCVLPIGGSNITRDLTVLQIEEEEAESLKKQYGDAYYEEEEGENSKANFLTAGGQAIPLRDFNDIVAARAEEILTNVWNQICLSGYDKQLFAGTILTGGASVLRNLEESFRKISGTNKVKSVHWPLINIQGLSKEQAGDGSWCGIIGLIQAGHENCCLQQKPEQKPEQVVTATTPPIEDKPTVAAGNSNGLFQNDEAWQQQGNGGTKETKEPTKPASKPDKTSKPIKKPNRFGKWFGSFSEEFWKDEKMND